MVIWQPTSFKRFVRAEETSTGPARIMTDAGEAVMKALGNKEGPHALAREYVAIRLAKWFGLPTFEYAIIIVKDDDQITLGRGKIAEPGPAFVTKYQIGQPWDGTAKGLMVVDNCKIITRLVVFDNWILNVDRYPPDISVRRPNPGNVFLSTIGADKGRFNIIVMDHTHCLRAKGTNDLSKGIVHIENIKDLRPYGVFPAFQIYLSDSELGDAIGVMSSLRESDIDDVLNGLPSEWQVSSEVINSVKEFLIQRARFLVQRLPSILSTYNLEQSKLDI